MDASEERSRPESCALMEFGDGTAAEEWRRTEERTSVTMLLFFVIRYNDKIIGQKIRRISGSFRLLPPGTPYLLVFGFL